MAGSSLIGNLAVSLTMETAAFQKSAAKMQTQVGTLSSKLQGFGKSLAGIGAGLATGILIGGLTSAAENAFELGSSLSEAAEKMGVTVEGLQRLRVAARETGVSNEQLDVAMTKLNKSLGELQFGSKAATEAFAAIGLSAADLKGKSPDEALRLIADALNKIPDPQQRIAAGAAIMGKNFAQLVPMISGGSAALEKYAQQSKASGEVSDANAKKLDDLADQWAGFKVGVGVATANIIANAATMYERVNGALHSVQAAADAFDAAVANMARNVVKWIGDMVTGIGAAITGRLNAIWDGAKEKIHSVERAFFDLYDKVVGHSHIPDMVEGIGRSISELQKVLVDPSIRATDKVGAAFQSLGNIVAGVFGNSKAGGILGALGQFASAIGPLFGGSIKAPTQGFIGPAMANGGSGIFGGKGGVDRNVLSLNGSPIARVSRGEHFSVTPANRAGQEVRVLVQANDYFDAKVANTASHVAAPIGARAAMAGASGGMQAVYRNTARQIP